MPTKLEMEQQLAGLQRELQSMQEAKQEAEERAQQTISGLEGAGETTPGDTPKGNPWG